MHRQNEVWVRGDRILRFSGFQVRRRPAEVADQIRRALVAAGWNPGLRCDRRGRELVFIVSLELPERGGRVSGTRSATLRPHFPEIAARLPVDRAWLRLLTSR